MSDRELPPSQFYLSLIYGPVAWDRSCRVRVSTSQLYHWLNSYDSEISEDNLPQFHLLRT